MTVRKKRRERVRRRRVRRSEATRSGRDRETIGLQLRSAPAEIGLRIDLQKRIAFATRRMHLYASSMTLGHSLRCLSRRAYSTGTGRAGTNAKLRALLRETAQPVAVVTSFMPKSSGQNGAAYHGATLSSFTSVALSPHPLVAFSLRVPSRMATTLSELAATPSPGVQFIVNILSARQADVAQTFSRTDLYPRPFESPQIRWSLTRDNLPLLHDSLGALACQVVGAAWPLNDLKALGGESAVVEGDAEGGDGVVSELFLARVLGVEDVPTNMPANDEASKLPLLYHRRGYGTVKGHPPGPPSHK